ncbi:hypothetical protein MtrunA17_Chr5g0408101 [Medicago truncatula]|uniref:Uncharacterized protein n=1 Tax=Medicago truncatula TaxID=3880 RepID=A0A396HRK4_MEDTR|nr:hypothetical protein MtrunA17_Chr5g0408101 [Medicago truncatula]
MAQHGVTLQKKEAIWSQQEIVSMTNVDPKNDKTGRRSKLLFRAMSKLNLERRKLLEEKGALKCALKKVRQYMQVLMSLNSKKNMKWTDPT